MLYHPHLERLFSEKPDCLRAIADTDPYDNLRRSAEALLAEADRLQVRGIEKLSDNFGGPRKFESLLSELRVGNMLARLGLYVEVLLDEAFGPAPLYAPDLFVCRGDGLEFLVEVVSGSSGSPNITTPLDRALKAAGLPFRVEEYLGKELSIPGVSWAERANQENAIREVVAGVIEHLARQPHSQTGEITVGGNHFIYGPSPVSEGYAAGGVSSCHFRRDQAHSSKFFRDVRTKAKRRANLPEARRSTPFIVAYDNREHELSPVTAHSALTGSRCPLVESDPDLRQRWKLEHPVTNPRVLEALANQWAPLVRAWDYAPDSDLRISEYGAYLEDAWAAELSGVLVTHLIDRVQWLPNPFAHEVLAEPRLLELGLPVSVVGESHPAWQRYP